jgi:sugar phosphate isomerase/epimerase
VGHLIAHTHIAEKEKRSAPGVMGDDFSPFFKAYKEIGYQGRISIEGRWKVEDLPKAFQVIRRQARAA